MDAMGTNTGIFERMAEALTLGIDEELTSAGYPNCCVSLYIERENGNVSHVSNFTARARLEMATQIIKDACAEITADELVDVVQVQEGTATTFEKIVKHGADVVEHALRNSGLERVWISNVAFSTTKGMAQAGNISYDAQVYMSGLFASLALKEIMGHTKEAGDEKMIALVQGMIDANNAFFDAAREYALANDDIHDQIKEIFEMQFNKPE